MRIAGLPERINMIRSLRRKHMVIFILLTVLLPFLFVLGLVARRPIAIMENVPEILTTGRGASHEP